MTILYVLLIVPAIALVLGFALPNKSEKALYLVSVASVVINMITLLAVGFLWYRVGFDPQFLKGPLVFNSEEIKFSISLYLDGYSYVYLLLATYLTGIIVVFSKNYIHREKGYKRYFNNIKFFYLGILIVLLAGNLELIFVGWEIIGVTSFFLIGFYRERYLPVKNAFKVVSLYRLADIALLLAIWLSHHYFGYSINFFILNLSGLHSPEQHIVAEQFYHFAIPAMFLIAAMVKSAQFPFSSWLPRAMEGPTTSSAIFYGSLYVHIGVFLLIRTAPFWATNSWFHIIIGGVGFITFILSAITSKVQATIKTQIAYSSLAQIGLMFIELAFGLYWVAIIHFVINALFRSHQLLISPSVLSHRIHDQVFHFQKPAPQSTQGVWNKVKLSVYILSIKEFNLDTFQYKFLWNPLKKLGKLVDNVDNKVAFVVGLVVFFTGLYYVYHINLLPHNLLRYASEFFAAFGLLFILKSFVERKNSFHAWALIIINQLYQSLAFGFNEQFDFNQVHIFLSGILLSSVVGFWVIQKLKKSNKSISLNDFHGHTQEHPRLAFLFLLASLGLAGFPITPTFIGEDLMLGHIEENQYVLVFLITLNLILDGLVIFRIYSRLFLGQHKSAYHEFAYRSS